jgi:hypothetical protein
MGQIRGPGIPLTFDSPQNTQRGEIITLPSGGQYYPLAGDYLIASGSQTILEWWDPNNLMWRAWAPPGSYATFTSDGGNFRLINYSGVVAGAKITNAGSGGTNGIGPAQTGVLVAIAAPAAGGVTATAQAYAIVGGSVAAPTITQGGSGFLVPPLILIDPPPQGGIQATAVATISAAGVITAITMQNVGAGYISTPAFYVVPNPQFAFATPQYPPAIGSPANLPGALGGAGVFPPPGLINPANVWAGSLYQGNIALGTLGVLLTPAVLTGSGTLTGLVITFNGGGYRGDSVPAISFSGGGLAGGVAATAIMSFCMNAATATATGGTAAVVGSPAITSLGLIASSFNNGQFWPRPARGLITAAAGSFTVEDPGFGLQGGAVLVNGGSTSLATVTNTQYGSIVDTTVIQSTVNS